MAIGVKGGEGRAGQRKVPSLKSKYMVSVHCQTGRTKPKSSTRESKFDLRPDSYS